jgi:pyruvate ferredoxin oxidoreductase alpha subunit
MLKQIEGSMGVALGVSLCRPEVICAYPISPQTHIVENLGTLTRQGKIEHCEYINVESEFAAMSTAIGASVAGARAYTATASQGLLYMTEAIYNAAGLGLPIVMTVANRAIGAPINIWNDHSDSLSQRDSGWIQLYVESNQEAVDMHIQAFRIAEELSLPVMVCMDGFVLTHAVERMDIPDQEKVDEFLPPYSPRQVLDPDAPVTIGAMVGPEAFTEVRYLAHAKHIEGLSVIEKVGEEFKNIFGRDSGGLVSCYRCEDADIRILAMGAAVGTIKDTVDELREAGIKVGVVSLKCYRPFPVKAVREALAGAKTVLVVDRALGAGSGGVVMMDVVCAVRDMAMDVRSVIAGLGGRAITKASVAKIVRAAAEGVLADTTFMDLDEDLVRRQLEREAATRLSGPLPEAIIHDVATRETSKE